MGQGARGPVRKWLRSPRDKPQNSGATTPRVRVNDTLQGPPTDAQQRAKRERRKRHRNRTAALERLGFSEQTAATIGRHLAEGYTAAETAARMGLRRSSVEQLAPLCNTGFAKTLYNTRNTARMLDIFTEPQNAGARIAVTTGRRLALNRGRDGMWRPNRQMVDEYPALDGLRQPIETAKQMVVRVIETARLNAPAPPLREQDTAALEAGSLAVRRAIERSATEPAGMRATTRDEIADCARRLADAAETATEAARHTNGTAGSDRSSGSLKTETGAKDVVLPYKTATRPQEKPNGQQRNAVPVTRPAGPFRLRWREWNAVSKTGNRNAELAGGRPGERVARERDRLREPAAGPAPGAGHSAPARPASSRRGRRPPRPDRSRNVLTEGAQRRRRRGDRNQPREPKPGHPQKAEPKTRQ